MKISLFCIFLLLFFINAKSQTTEIPGPAGSGLFGSEVYTLTNGNFVVVDQEYDDGATQNVGCRLFI